MYDLTAVNEASNVLDNELTKIKSYMKDMSVPLDERWSVFSSVQKYLDVHGWTVSIPEIENHNMCWYDDFCKDRYANVDYDQIVESLEGRRECKDLPDGFDVDSVKEWILESGDRGFVNDW